MGSDCSTDLDSPTVQIALVNPVIPPNTGNIGRTCVGFNAQLELVGELGFSLDDSKLKRAGLDYWPNLDWHHQPDEKEFQRMCGQEPGTLLLSKKGGQNLLQTDLTHINRLVFGSETSGLDASWYEFGLPAAFIPSSNGIRSYNLANAVAMVLFEWVRQNNTWQSLGHPAQNKY